MYTIKQAAARAGLTPTVARAWERRYGVVHPTRSASGYRLYDDESIERLRRMRSLIERGWAASEAARAVVDGSVDATELAPDSTRMAATDAGDPVEAFLAAAASLDGAAIEAALDEMLGRGSFESVVDAWLMRAAATLGDAWATGRITVGAEHVASAAIARRLAAAYQAAGRPSGAPVLVGLPPGSRHELGALAYATAVRRRGIAVLYLGADVPIASWVHAAQRLQPLLAVIAVVTTDDVPPAREVAAALTEPWPGVPVLFGGDAAPESDDGGTIVRLPDSINGAAERTVELLAARSARDGSGRPG